MNEQKENTIIEKDYITDLNQIKETIKANQVKAMVVVNSAMIMTYYEIGTIINKRKTWGSKYIQNLASDLKEYGNSYSFRNLKYMSQFAKEFSKNEIRHQAGAQIPWRTIIEIMAKSSSHEEMLWYINETHKNGWSRSQVELQFKSKAYERYLINPDTSIQDNEIAINTELNEIIKDTYVLDFLGINDIQSEIDLLFYHIPSHSYVVIELKTTKFKPEYIGQLLFYTNYIDEYIKNDLDSPTIGIVLCSEANSVVCKTTLKNTKNLAISKYKILEELPEYLSKKLMEK